MLAVLEELFVQPDAAAVSSKERQLQAAHHRLQDARVELIAAAAGPCRFWARPALPTQPERAAPLRDGVEAEDTTRPPVRPAPAVLAPCQLSANRAGRGSCG
eukprot:COSAG04_NODE_5368_length_1641_cov_0.991569_3_plen_102_part_00